MTHFPWHMYFVFVQSFLLIRLEPLHHCPNILFPCNSAQIKSLPLAERHNRRPSTCIILRLEYRVSVKRCVSVPSADTCYLLDLGVARLEGR